MPNAPERFGFILNAVHCLDVSSNRAMRVDVYMGPTHCSCDGPLPSGDPEFVRTQAGPRNLETHISKMSSLPREPV